ncbi:hypothetical protein Tco_0539897 [Tanacetum coccineum]
MLRSSQPESGTWQDIDPLQHAEVCWLISHVIGFDQEGAIYYTISGTPGGTRRILIRRVVLLTLSISDTSAHSKSWGEAEERPQPITPLNPASNATTNNQAPFVTPIHMEVQAVDEAFVMANYSRLEPRMRRRMRELRLQGVATRLNYSSEDVDEEREMEAPPGFQPRPSDMTEEPIYGEFLRGNILRSLSLSPI